MKTVGVEDFLHENHQIDKENLKNVDCLNQNILIESFSIIMRELMIPLLPWTLRH
jgi:hypothetical protein